MAVFIRNSKKHRFVLHNKIYTALNKFIIPKYFQFDEIKKELNSVKDKSKIYLNELIILVVYCVYLSTLFVLYFR